MTTTETPHRPIHGAALVAGLALLGMAVLAGLANFGVVENLVTAGDAEQTARDIRASEGLFRLGVAGLLLVAILDVVAAWALMVFFRPAHEGLATLTAWLRAVYAAVFAVAIAQLAGVPALLGAAGHPQAPAEALLKITAFHDIWDAGLTLFGLHLALLGYLAYISGYVPRLLGVLVAFAGLGYLVDSLGTFLVPGYALEAAVFTFVGEVALMVWLLAKGRRVAVTGPAPAGTAHRHR
ncbi:hypothetical protein HNP84_006479 [Thermocatellispora tengchongensis]|uniref:DUF4386 domain-containing protein n=1 Tax=Thermocatellispora tengchongensis TaxID=1073253 RepID=A0A840PAQ9_9ACTN|nr:DUF4386 domain-containing protein [Thermocatellispora tengchongensis]MBB5136728.1 hypothetical protein [Thermocatellispora tengchongensis]